MERMFGTVVRGVRAPIIREGDDLAAIVADTVVSALASENIPIGEKDVVAVTEAVVARAQGNYATVDQIAADVRAKLGGETIGIGRASVSGAEALEMMGRRGEKPLVHYDYLFIE